MRKRLNIKYNINKNNFRIDKSLVELYSLPVEMKKEFTFKKSDYKDLEVEEGILAYARILITLLFLKPGTYPNSPYMGIDIREYQFELMDNDSITAIEQQISEQLKQYIPQERNCSITLELLDVPTGDVIKKVLALKFFITDIDYSQNDFIIFIDGDDKNNVSITFN